MLFLYPEVAKSGIWECPVECARNKKFRKWHLASFVPIEFPMDWRINISVPFFFIILLF